MLFAVGNRALTHAVESNEFRTDRVLIDSASERIQKELLDNWISHTSPVTFEKKTGYCVPNDLFNSWFRSF